MKAFSELHTLLPEHDAYFQPTVGKAYGIGIYISKKINVISNGYHMIYENLNYPGHGPTHSRLLQWLKCSLNNKIFYVLNIHGLWNGMGKTDTEARINQSKKIREFMETLNALVILCGDLNLRPDTESIRILGKNMDNLIKKYNIKSTRTNLYLKNEKFADYIFTSQGIKVGNFKVMDDVVSDHAPLFLDFKL